MKNKKKLDYKKILAFSLMELIMVIAMIIILSAIAGPLYKSYSSKSKLAEGYVLLGTIRSAQDLYYSEHNCYFYSNEYTCNHEVLGIDARVNKYFTWFCVGNEGWLNNVSCRKATVTGNLTGLTCFYSRTAASIIK